MSSRQTTTQPREVQAAVRGRVGAITIGQSPRPDITDEIRPLLGEGTRLIEIGALDGLTGAEIAALRPGDDDHTLVTLLRDGREVLIGRRHLVPRIQACVDRLQEQVELILMLCTGTFPPFRTRRLVLYPEHLLFQTVRAVTRGASVGVLTPSARQIADQERRWREVAASATVRAFSPYTPADDLDAACADFNAGGVDVVVLDCLGYTTALKRDVRAKTGKPVLLARTVLARTAAELVG
ncbi:MAG: AroM family protein [Armatimonadota bacterium]|nr:AroM family protein [Armatimonadota bacterium]